MKRLKPEQIKAGHSYRLVPRYVPGTSIVRRVEEIADGNVVVVVKGERKVVPLEMFADLAVEEVKEEEKAV